MGEVLERRCRHVGDDGDDDVRGALELPRDGPEEITAQGLDAVGAGAGHRNRVDVGADDAGRAPSQLEDSRDRTGAGAQIDRTTGFG